MIQLFSRIVIIGCTNCLYQFLFVFQHGIIETLNGPKNRKSSKFTSGEFTACVYSSALMSCSANASLNSLLSSQIWLSALSCCMKIFHESLSVQGHFSMIAGSNLDISSSWQTSLVTALFFQTFWSILRSTFSQFPITNWPYPQFAIPPRICRRVKSRVCNGTQKHCLCYVQFVFNTSFWVFLL